MIPPAPNLTDYIDEYEEGAELSSSNKSDQQRQKDYEAEVRVYRALERLESDIMVFHSLKYLHGDYKLFVGDHQVLTGKRKGNKCTLKDRDPEGECDFMAVGSDYVAVIEVKNVAVEDSVAEDEKKRQCEALAGTFKKSDGQRLRAINLVKGILGEKGNSVRILQFSAYPNLSAVYKTEFPMDEDLLSTVIFKEDLSRINEFWKTRVLSKQSSELNPTTEPSSLMSSVSSLLSSVQPYIPSEQGILFGLQGVSLVVQTVSSIFRRDPEQQDAVVDDAERQLVDTKILDDLKYTLLALWCTEKNKCMKQKCSLGWYISDIDRQIKTGDITFRSKKRDPNPSVFEAPDEVKKFIGVNNLTAEQNRILESVESLLWINRRNLVELAEFVEFAEFADFVDYAGFYSVDVLKIKARK